MMLLPACVLCYAVSCCAMLWCVQFVSLVGVVGMPL